MLLCATGMEHGHGRGGGESLIFDPGRVLMKRRHSACALQPETELEKKKKTAAFPPSGSLASIRTTYVDIPNSGRFGMWNEKRRRKLSGGRKKSFYLKVFFFFFIVFVLKVCVGN